MRTFNYDANYNPASVTDSVGTLASFQFNPNQTLAAGAIGFDITAEPCHGLAVHLRRQRQHGQPTDALGRTTSTPTTRSARRLTMTEPTPTRWPAPPPPPPPTPTTPSATSPRPPRRSAAPPAPPTTPTATSSPTPTPAATSPAISTTPSTGSSRPTIPTAPNPPRPTTSATTWSRRPIRAGNVTLTRLRSRRPPDLGHPGYGTATPPPPATPTTTPAAKPAETDALGHTTTYTYDAAGNLTAISGRQAATSPTPTTTRATRSAMTDGNDNTTQFHTTPASGSPRPTYPDQTTEINSYDGPGNLISVTDQAGNTVQYTYDAANQLINVVQLNHPNPSSQHHLLRLRRHGNPSRSKTQHAHHGQRLRPLERADAEDAARRHADRDAHLRRRRQSRLGHALQRRDTTYTYDALNRLLTRATPGETTVSFTYTPPASGQTMTDASGTPRRILTTRWTGLRHKPTPEGTLSYTYDAAGNLAPCNRPTALSTWATPGTRSTGWSR